MHKAHDVFIRFRSFKKHDTNCPITFWYEFSILVVLLKKAYFPDDNQNTLCENFRFSRKKRVQSHSLEQLLHQKAIIFLHDYFFPVFVDG